MTIGIIVNAVFFFCMGASAIVRPRSVVSFVPSEPETIDARNEVRVVDGGFGLAVSLRQIFAVQNEAIKPGATLAVAVSLFGMALRRVSSLFIERLGKWPMVFIFTESGLEGLLLWA